MKYNYTQLYNKNAAFFEKRPILKKALPLINTIITGLFFVAYAGLFYYGATKGEFKTKDFVNIFCAVCALFYLKRFT